MKGYGSTVEAQRNKIEGRRKGALASMKSSLKTRNRAIQTRRLAKHKAVTLATISLPPERTDTP